MKYAVLVLGLAGCAGRSIAGDEIVSPMMDAGAIDAAAGTDLSARDAALSPSCAPSAPMAWTMYQGDAQHTGRSPLVGAQGGTVAWHASIGGPGMLFADSPAIAPDGTLYVGADTSMSTSSLYAVTSSGSIAWSTPVGHLVYNSPALGADGTIYVVNVAGALIALAPDGAIVWSIDLGANSSGVDGRSAPTIAADGTIYAFNGGGTDVVAVQPSGAVKWKYTTAGALNGSVALAADQQTLFIGAFDGTLYAIGADGTLVWQRKLPGTMPQVVSSPVIAADATLYVVVFDVVSQLLYAFHPNGDVAWSLPTGQASPSVWAATPALGRDGTIYVGLQDSQLWAVAPDGTRRWSLATTQGRIMASPVIGGDNQIVFATEAGHVYGARPDGSVAWDYQAPSSVYSSVLLGPCVAYVGVTNNDFFAIH